MPSRLEDFSGFWVLNPNKNELRFMSKQLPNVILGKLRACLDMFSAFCFLFSTPKTYFECSIIFYFLFFNVLAFENNESIGQMACFNFLRQISAFESIKQLLSYMAKHALSCFPSFTNFIPPLMLSFMKHQIWCMH